jgi:glucose/arabinose dehydrogenase
VPTGYKLVRLNFDANGNYLETEDFITGWLTADNLALGRPAGLIWHQGNLYLADDKAGVIYKISYQP